MRSADLDILIIPGWTGSGPDHWQSRWQAKLPTARRVEQDDWQRPLLVPWTERIAEHVTKASRPVLIVAHSLGVQAVAHAAHMFAPGKVAGGFLVVPPSSEAILATKGIMDEGFAKHPNKLDFTSVLIASRNDSFARFAEQEAFADRIGAELIDAGEAGHINAASGHGPWPEGLMSFAGFLRKLG
ncbi:MAG: RBBP9/YdeN family alpha/beta hydrolase [Bosea sp. (in: a-proteobacteria)]